MVITRSRTLERNQAEQVETFSDNGSNTNFSDLCSRNHLCEPNEETVQAHERDCERISMEQRLMDMNHQILELTSMVRALAEKNAFSNREESAQNVHKDKASSLSDMVPGVSENPPNPTPKTNQPRRTPQLCHELHMQYVMTEIQKLRSTRTDGLFQPKILQTEVLLFRRNREKYNDMEHLLKNHLSPHMHKLTRAKLMGDAS